MAKKGRGNADYFNATNLVKKEKTTMLIREAVSLMNETNEILEIKVVSQKTKEIDSEKKGVSEATFRKKDLEHIQLLMLELGIGKYGKIKVSQTSQEITLSQHILELQKENKKALQQILDYKKMLKTSKSKLENILIENEELRVKIYEMEMNEKIKHHVNGVNNL